MNQKTILSITSSTLVASLAVAGITYAATPASNNTTLLGQGTVEVDSIKVGNPNAGGVTFFNGTIVNESAPVTFGDDVRVDGRIWRGKNQGPGLGDNKPFIINDDAQVAGTFTVGGTDIFAAIDAKSDKSAVTTNATNIASNDTDIAANTTAINNNASNISSKANSVDVYTQTQIDTANTAQDLVIQSKANTADVYTQAQADAAFVEVGSSKINLPASSFMPQLSSTAYAKGAGIGENYIYPSGGAAVFVAPLHLPQNSFVGSIDLNFVDTAGAGVITSRVYRQNITSGTVDSLASGASEILVTAIDSGSGAGILQESGTNLFPSTPNLLTIDNDNFTYFAVLDFSAAGSTSFNAVSVEVLYTTQ